MPEATHDTDMETLESYLVQEFKKMDLNPEKIYDLIYPALIGFVVRVSLGRAQSETETAILPRIVEILLRCEKTDNSEK